MEATGAAFVASRRAHPHRQNWTARVSFATMSPHHRPHPSVDHWSQWTPILKLFPQTHTQHSSSYSTKSFIIAVRPDLVTTREISAVDLPYSRRRPFESTRNWIAVRNDPPPDLVRHRVTSRGGDKRGTTWDDSCGRAAIPVAISIRYSSAVLDSCVLYL